MDYSGSSVTPGRLNTAITGATTTDVVAAPGSSVFRNVRTLNICNKHASLSVDVEVRHTDGSTNVELFEATLSAGQTLQYLDGIGWQIVQSGFASLIARVTGSNVAYTGQTLQDITGLTLALPASTTWLFESLLSASTTAVTTGIKYAVAFSGAGATIEGGIVGSSNATTATTAERINALATATVNAFLLGSAQTGILKIQGILVVSTTAGNLTIQHLKVTSGTSTVFINSFLKAMRIA
jgi:hypothetical protein